MGIGELCQNCLGRGWLGDAAYMESSECPICKGKGWLGATTIPTQKELVMTYREDALPPICATCNGKGSIGDGKVYPVTVCSSCHGSGTMSENNINETKETVNHPSHYNQGSIEVIDAIEDWKMGFNDGNAIKYIARHRAKGKPEEDLRKALWYIARELIMVHHVDETELATMIQKIEKK